VLREITPDGFVKTFPETGLRATFDSGFGAEFQFSASPQSLNGLAYSSVSQELFALSSDKIKVFTRAGELLRLYSVNEAYDDLSVVPEAISLGGTNVPAGSLLASTRDTFFALSPFDGSVLASVTASLDENFSISYDPNSNEILTHNLYGNDAVQRFDPITGTLTSSVIATEIEFGDVEFLTTSGGFISANTASSNGYTVVTEFDANGSIVRTLDLTATFGIRPLSSQSRGGITGLAYDEVNDTLFLAGTDGLIYSIDGLFAADSTKNAWTVQLDTSEVVEDIDFGNVPIIAPTDLHLSINSIAENQAIGTVVGTFLTDDASLADHHRYLLVAGENDSDNSRFTIDGNTLKAAEQFDFEHQSLYSIRVRSTDSLGQYVEKSIQIFVNNVNEPPTALILDDSHVFEEQPIGTSVGRFTAEDPETFDPFHFSLVDCVGDADNASFTVEGDTLKTNVVFDFETRTSYSIRVQVADPEGATYEQRFEITVDQIRGVPPLVDINSQPPGADSTPVNLVDVNGVLYFVANDGVQGNELWKSDGSASGTMLVKDIHPGAGFAELRYLTNVNGTLFFQADDGVHGQELWKSDGTVEGTVLVKDLNVGGAHASPYNLTNADGMLFFTARDNSSGYELWRSDGTESGTVMIKDIHPGSNSSYPRYFTNVNGTIYFRADDGTHGFELWKSDGTAEGTTLVKDIVPGGDAGWVPQRQPINVDGTVYFLADDGAQGTELWKSDGTPEGTVVVADVHPGPQSSFPSSLTGVNGTLYFLADDGTRGRELWKTNGTSGGTELVSDIHPGANASFSFYAELVSVDDVLYFAATDGVAGYELWRSDGTTAGTLLVADINPGGSGSSPSSLIAAGDFLYFTADNGVGGFELWRSDGTTAGTQLLLDITEDSTSSFPYLLTRSGEHIFFAATTEIYGTELYTVPKSNPVLTWNAPNSITFGTLLSNTQLNATSNVAGTFAYSPAVGTKLNAGADQQLNVTFTPTDTLNYNNATASVLVDVLKSDPIITWNAPSDITFDTLLSNTQLNATSNVAGTFTYSPAVGTQLNAGADQQLSVTFTPTDTLNYNDATASVVISVFRLFDYGDAPSASQSGFTSDYPVTLAQDGARHSESSLFLGSLIDTETDGQASTSAGQNGVEGDDGSGLRDEDGVRFISTLVAQSSTVSSSSVAVTASAAGKLDAWIDFNRDGDWLDAGEQIFSSLPVQAGSNTLAFSIPPGASIGETYARFRLSSTGGLAPTGAANDGEVEDYRVEILDGDAVSGVDVAIASGGADPLDLIVEGNQVIVRRGATELFRASRNSLNSIDVAGTDGDDTLEIADVSLIVDGLITGNLGTGNDVLRLMGSNQTLNLAQIVGANIQGLDAIDITGSGANSLTLDPDDVRAISVITKTFRVQHDNDDAVTYAGNWTAGFPEVIAGQFVHVLTLGDATVQVVNTVPFHNPLVALDADRDGHVSPLDALIIINDLNATGPHALLQPISVATLTNFYYVDINHDGAIAPIDVLVVINLLNARVGDAEPELAASSLLPYNAPPSIATMASLETRKGILSDTPMGFASRPPTPQVSGSRLSVAAVRQNVTTGTPSKSHRDDLIDTLDAFFAELGSVSD
jgi:ELWxxDGT repeat protein